MANRLQLDKFLPYRLSITSNLVSDRIARTYEALFGLTIPEWRLVAVIAEAGAITQAEIGERTRMDKVTVSRAAIALVGRSLLTRAPNAGDRRSHLLSLTTEGQSLYEAVAPKALAMEAELFGRFTAAELAAFTAMLHRIDAAAREERS
jgi:DNA-binding MarR family transcriptional regulator